MKYQIEITIRFKLKHKYLFRLVMDKTPLNMWAVPKGLDALLYPFGMQGSNPNLDSPRLELVFEKGRSNF